MRNLIICFTLALLVAGTGKAYAQNIEQKDRFILVQTTDDKLVTYPVTDGTTFRTTHAEEFVIETPGAEASTIDLKTVKAFGVTSRLRGPSSGADSMVFDQALNWSVVTLDGITVRSGKGTKPDLSGLQKGKVYIIRSGAETFKYVVL